MTLFGWCIEFNHGQIGFSKSKKELITLASQRGESGATPFAVYRALELQPATDVAQPGEAEDGPRTA